MKYKKLTALIIGILSTSSFASSVYKNSRTCPIGLLQQPGFFRFSFDNVKMPSHIQNMGLLGINYFSDFTPDIYGGVGGYGAVTGNQGGLFVLGFSGGLHRKFADHWWGDIGLFAGGGGGRSALVGGGLMLRPYAGIAYDWCGARFGVHYSYIDFPSGLIRSQQVGLDLDIPWDFYYVSPQCTGSCFCISDILPPAGKFLDLQRNDFSIFLQSYFQHKGTKNVLGIVQDGTMGLVGAELDHYITDKGFWWVKTSGAFHGIPNGYMDILGGLGYHWPLSSCGIAVIPQIGIGAGGGGNVNTGGGVLINPLLGLELPLTSSFAVRASGGYLWSPKGSMNAVTATGSLIYHLDMLSANCKPACNLFSYYRLQGWRIQLFNQTYFHPARASNSITSAINMVALQIDQLFTPIFFFSYQAASAYTGNHAGGLATGMIGPGLQTPKFCYQRAQLFTELLIGAGGGGGLALGGGAIVEPVIGAHFALTPTIGLQASYSQIKALQHNLNTPVLNFGVTVGFGTLQP